MEDDRPILVTGATGYVGGRLVPRLLTAGYRVRAVARSLNKLSCRPWVGHPNLELARADLLDRESLTRACQGCRAAYYLVHSMNPHHKKDYAEVDRRAAQNFAAAAAACGAEQIIYLGGLGNEQEGLSEHLKSRTEVARVLQAGPVPVTFLRAAMLIGSGSASFEIMRYLVDRLPMMITPIWVDTQVQPISIRDALSYLTGCLERPETKGQTYDIGGPEVVTYRQLFAIYAEEAGLTKRRIIRVPFFTPTLSSYWIHLVTPIPAALAQPLAKGLKNTVVVTDHRLADLIPLNLMTPRQVIRRALEKRAGGLVETSWTDAGFLTPPEWVQVGDASYSGGRLFREGFRVVLQGDPGPVWEVVTQLGGANGWGGGNYLWRLRGLMDELIGGVGLRRGRRHPRDLQIGDALDFWRVMDIEQGRRLVLLAEMYNPGEAVLEILVDRLSPERTSLNFITRFHPRGLLGLVYWYAVSPLHHYVFQRMCLGLARKTGLPVVGGPARFKPAPAMECRLEPPPRKRVEG